MNQRELDIVVRIVDAMGDPTDQCYVATEALWHALGGHWSSWRPCVLRLGWWARRWVPRRGAYVSPFSTHWYLESTDRTRVLDPTAHQFQGLLTYAGRPCGFLTRYPSRRARALLHAAGLPLPNPWR